MTKLWPKIVAAMAMEVTVMTPTQTKSALICTSVDMEVSKMRHGTLSS